MSTTERSPALVGIEVRTDAKGRKAYRPSAYDKRAKRNLKGPWASTLAEARSWRVDAMQRFQVGTLSADQGLTVREAAEQFIAGIKSGAIPNRSGKRYRPSVVTGYEREFRNRVLPALGAARLRRLTAADVQVWTDTLVADGLAPNTIRNVITPLQALYGWAIPRGLAHVSPCASLRMPSGEQKRDRIATAAEAAVLIAAIPARDQAALGLAVYAGLRVGELVAIEWEAIDLELRTLRVVRGWDENARQFLDAKTKAGQNRVVPIVDPLATLISDHAVLMDHPTEGLLFPGQDATRPLSTGRLRNRAKDAWKEAELRPLGFHEGRHTFASLMIDAGINAKAISTYMGHANISITLDRYGHLMPGNEDEARTRLNAYLAREGG
ncbi:MAG: tyrosine-type recombinase/integrase [Solirubrobacterales bacterium]